MLVFATCTQFLACEENSLYLCLRRSAFISQQTTVGTAVAFMNASSLLLSTIRLLDKALSQ